MIDLNLRRDLISGLRHAGISDERVLAAMEAVPRDRFVHASFGDQSYRDTALPIDCGQTISQPFVVAVMTAFLEVGPRMKVLEIGTGSGYQAAVLSRLCRRVYTIERFRKLLRQAEDRFKALDLHNITTRFGDGMKGWPEQAPFDRIIVTAGAEEVPQTLLGQLKDGGIMVIPAGSELLGQRLLQIRRTADRFETHKLDAVRFVPLLPGTVEDSN